MLSEPVTHFRREPLDIVAGHIAQAARGLALDLDGQVGLRRGRRDDSQEVVCVARGVGMGKTVAQMLRDVDVVPMADERRCIGPAPWPNDASCPAQDMNGSSMSEERFPGRPSQRSASRNAGQSASTSRQNRGE